MKPVADSHVYSLSRFFWLILAVLCIVQTWLVVEQWHTKGVVGSLDTDPWVRLVRTEHLLHTGQWYNRTIDQLNPPQGMQSHWTRPLDVILILCAFPLTFFMTSKMALFAVASWLNALWLFLSAAAMVWAVRPLRLGLAGQATIALGFVMDPLMTLVYAPGRASDHHSLLALLGIILFGLCMHQLCTAAQKGRMILAGLVAAIGVWIAPEFLAVAALVYIGFGLCWLRGDSTALVMLKQFALSLCVGLALALVAERGFSDLLSVQHDRVSVVHVVLAALAYCIVMTASLVRHHAYLIFKLVILAVSGALSLALMHLLFPEFHLGPMAAMEPGLRAAFNANVNELQSAFNVDKLMLSVSFYDGLMVTAIVALVRIITMSSERRMWASVLLVLGVFGTLVTYQLRWNYYVLPIGLIGLAVIAEWISVRVTQPARQRYFSVLIALLVASSCVWPALWLPATAPKHDEFHAPAYTTACSKELQRLIQNGDAVQLLGDKPVVVLTAPYLAPQLIYFTPHKAIASFYHNLTDGLNDLNRFFHAQTAEQAQTIVKKWQVDYLLFCADDLMKPFEKSKQDVSAPFIHDLLAGKIPGWLEHMPGSNDSKLLFFRVK